MNKKISVNLALAIAIIAMTVTFSITMILSQNLFDKTVSSVREKEIMYNKIAEIDKTVRADFYGEINNATLYDLMGAGYVQALGDASAKYYTAAKYLDLQAEQKGQIVGIGVELVKESAGYLRVIRVYNGSTAQEAGVQRNYTIMRIGTVDTKTVTIDQAYALLRGEAGTTVSIEVLNELGEGPAVMELQRRVYDVPSVYYDIPHNKNIGFVRITTFNVNTVRELENAINNLLAGETPINALVFDVRNNTGGSLAAAIDCIDFLCPAGAVANRLNKDGTITLYDTSDLKEIDLPMAVITNANTASGAELFAANIRDFGKGKIVGVRSAGKGSILCEPQRLSDGSAITYTIGILLTRNEENFNGVGITPDVDSTLKPEEEKIYYDLTIDNDPQILKAFETAESLITKRNVQSGTSNSSSSSSAPEASQEPESTGGITVSMS